MQELEGKNGQLLEQRLAQTRAEGEAAQLRLEMDQLRASSRVPAATPRRKTADIRPSNTGTRCSLSAFHGLSVVARTARA